MKAGGATTSKKRKFNQISAVQQFENLNLQSRFCPESTSKGHLARASSSVIAQYEKSDSYHESLMSESQGKDCQQ